MAVTFLEKIPVLRGVKAKNFIDKVNNESKLVKLSAKEKQIIEEIKKYSNI